MYYDSELNQILMLATLAQAMGYELSSAQAKKLYDSARGIPIVDIDALRLRVKLFCSGLEAGKA